MELKKVQEIFNQNRFVIPNYQRGYAWENDQISDFITDIKDAADIEEHYTGQIIVASKKQETIGTVSYDVYEVVDGQQRLTTISIYIFCVCNRLKQLSQDPERIIDNVIYKNIPILKLNDDNDKFYRTIILGNNTETPVFENKSQRNLFNAKKQISSHLETYKSKVKLFDDYKILMHKFKVNFSILTSHLEAGLVFETMNDRGIALNQMDKVKNYLIYLCSRLKNKSLAKTVSDSYSKIFSELMKIEGSINRIERTEKIEDDFLSCAYFLFCGKNFKDSVHHHIKTEFLPKREVIKKTAQIEIDFLNDKNLSYHQKNIEELSKFLSKSSVIYSSVFNCSFKVEGVNELLKRINFLGGTEKHSRLLLSIFMNCKEGSLISVLKLLEVLVFRSKKQISTNELALKIKNNKYSVVEIRNELRNLIGKYCSSASFVDMLNSSDFYEETKNNFKAYYFFYEYEVYVSKEKNTDCYLPSFEVFCKKEYKKFEIEHIDPQQPSGRSAIKSVNQLGNLTGTFDNGKLHNKEFLDKKNIFKHSKLNIEKQLINYEKWDDKVVKHRTDELIKFAKKRWDY